MDTERLIRVLTDQVEPIRPLWRPWLRTAGWTAAAAIYLVMLVIVASPRSDLDARMRDPRFLIEQAAALLTGVTAAVAAFATVVPGYRRRIIGIPIAAGATWIATVGLGALQEVDGPGSGGVLLQADWGCVWTVLAGASVPAGLMAMMLRRGAPLTPHLTAALGGLAAAGLGNLGICLFHSHDSNLVMLVWHCGTVLLVAALAGATGARWLHWPRGEAIGAAHASRVS